MSQKTKILCIFDGFGLAPESVNNCVARAQMPNFRRLLSTYHWGLLDADGEDVGQEAGLVGNSEVGHMNIGGLKLVPQLSYQITKSAGNAFDTDEINYPDQLLDPKEHLKSHNSRVVHLVGLFSTGSIHSDLRHWVGAVEAAGKAGVQKIVFHIISDGRDSDKKSLVATWENFIQTYSERLKPFEDKIFLGSVSGRFYPMDRDKNWDRVSKGLGAIFWEVRKQDGEMLFNESVLREKYNYDLPLKAGSFDENTFEYISSNLNKVTELNYSQNIYDENIDPICFYDDMQVGDTVWLLNFRSDRMKQLTQMMCEINQEYDLNLNILAMNDYGIDSQYSYTSIFKTRPVQNTLAQTISEMGKTQLHIAETEKYAHVTYFLNGGVEVKNQGEDWVVIPSNKVSSHAEKPEMKAKEVTDYILENGLGKYDYIIVNYANPDMVGHTGDTEAGIQSMEFLDKQLGRLIDQVEQGGHSLILIADHGNMEFVGEYKKNGKQLTDTEHNANPVPFIIVNSEHKAQNRDFSENWITIEEIEAKKKNQLPLWHAGKKLLEL